MTKKQSFTLYSDSIYFFKYILRMNIGFLGLSWIFILIEMSILIFAELATFHFI